MDTAFTNRIPVFLLAGYFTGVAPAAIFIVYH
jgi:hypothetical protein